MTNYSTSSTETNNIRKNASQNPYWELCRPFTLLAPGIGFIAFALAGWSGLIDVSLLSVLPAILAGALSAALLNAASNIINQYFDLEIDRINKPTRPFPSGRVSIQQGMIFCFILYFLSFFTAYLVGWQFFWIVIFTAFVTYAYSGQPFRTKRHWFWANLTIAIPRGCLLVVAGWTAVRSLWEAEPWVIGGIFGLYILGAASTKDFADIEGDRAGGCITLPIRFGVERSAQIISPFFVLPFVLLFLAAFMGWLSGDRFILMALAVLMILWGVYVAYLIVRRPSELATEANHVSWKHMYLMMLFGQIGVAAAYLLRG
ncbi:MAG: UbiA family prenyltransferase [Candidatus Omnitrophica bacterium]|nr:UbiA family prenyltransferase [Candidatus Omnitrophota bacterium]